MAGRGRLCGSNSEVAGTSQEVRYCPNSGAIADIQGLRISATCELMQCRKEHPYSITSSATVSSLTGIVKPSACAVLRLITISKSVGCTTGRSAGLAPLNTPVHVSAKLEAAAQSRRQQGPLDRKGDLDPPLPLPRRPAAGIAGDAFAGSLGLQLGSHHAHARDAHLSITAKDREGCHRSDHPGY